MSTPDAFRYARYALEIRDDTYSQIDYLADAPHYAVRQYPPSLLCLFAVYISRLSGIDINYLFLLMPTVFSIFFVIPLCLILKPLNNSFVTIGAVSMGLFNFHYFERTHLGYFDTDCLMLFFVFLILYLFAGSIRHRGDNYKPYLYILYAAIATHLFIWWYDGHLFFVFILSACLLCGLIINRCSIGFSLKVILFYIVLLNPFELAYYAFTSPFIKDYIYGTLISLKTYKSPINIYSTIGEIQPVSLSSMVNMTTDNWVTFTLAVIMLILLYIRHLKNLSVMLPIALLGFLSLYMGYRYMIYLGPFIGMGMGYGISIISGYISRRYKLKETFTTLVFIIFLIGLTLPLQRFFMERKPFINDSLQKRNFQILKEKTEPDAFILSWWDRGNMLQYYTGRATFTDNTQFSGHKIYLTVDSLLSEDKERAYKNIASLTHLIHRNSKDERSLGNKNVYLYLYEGVLTNYILKGNNLSKEDEKRFQASLPAYFFSCDPIKEGIIDCEDLSINIIDGALEVKDENVNRGYKSIIFINKIFGGAKKVFPLNTEKGVFIQYIVLTKSGQVSQIIAREGFEKTLLYKLTILTPKGLRHFELIHDDYPRMVLYRVKD